MRTLTIQDRGRCAGSVTKLYPGGSFHGPLVIEQGLWEAMEFVLQRQEHFIPLVLSETRRLDKEQPDGN